MISQAAQVAVWAFVGSIAALAVVVVVVRLPSDDLLPIATQSALLVSAANGAAIASCALAVCILRDSALFRYFKNR